MQRHIVHCVEMYKKLAHTEVTFKLNSFSVDQRMTNLKTSEHRTKLPNV